MLGFILFYHTRNQYKWNTVNTAYIIRTSRVGTSRWIKLYEHFKLRAFSCWFLTKHLGNNTLVSLNPKIIGSYMRVFTVFLKYTCLYYVRNTNSAFDLSVIVNRNSCLDHPWSCTLLQAEDKPNLFSRQNLHHHSASNKYWRLRINTYRLVTGTELTEQSQCYINPHSKPTPVHVSLHC